MLPLITPPQGQPFLEGALCGRVYYLYFQALTQAASTGGGIVQFGTRRERTTLGTQGLANGTLWIETDSGLVYQWQVTPTSMAWVYISGTYATPQAQLSTVAGLLGANDTGLLVNVTDYAHILEWTGSGWQWGPGEQGSGMMALFEVDPTGAGWHLYDGTANVKYLKSDGTTGTVTLPDLVSAGANAAYPKAGSPNSGPNAAAAPTFTGGSVTPTGTISAIASSLTATVNVTPSGATPVAAGAHTHPAPSFNGLPLTPTGTISTGGEPRNLVRRPWFRQ